MRLSTVLRVPVRARNRLRACGHAACLLTAIAAGMSEGAAWARMEVVPFRYRTVSGTRPFVPVRLNGIPFEFMVHANATFLAMTTHANAKAARIGPLIQIDQYGISSAGHVSAMGRARATVQSLRVGGDVVHDATMLIFETPQKPVMDGMLGLAWLRERKAFIDFGRKRLLIPGLAEDARDEGRRLREAGYAAHPMRWNEARKAFVVTATVNGAAADLVVSTVAELVVDEAFATASRLTSGPVVETYAGPSGATGSVRHSLKPFSMTINGDPATSSPATIYDIYAYEKTRRPPASADMVGGFLGCDFMIANSAVIDFGGGTLYLRPSGRKSLR